MKKKSVIGFNQNPTKEIKEDNPEVNNPDHYTQGGIECIDAMESTFGKGPVYWFSRCNAFKYLWRAGLKDNELQDLQKAEWYLKKAISLYEEAEEEETNED